MIKLLGIVSLTFAMLLMPISAQAERITVTSGVGDSLLDACSGSPDARIVRTNKGNYNGCCSKSLGYCVLCPVTGQCYKFSNLRALTEFQRDPAPEGDTIVNDEPARPFRGIRKAVPDGMKLVE